MILFLAEGSTPFLHICWLLHNLKRAGTRVFSILFGLLLLNFLLFRVLNLPYITVRMMMEKNIPQYGNNNGGFLFWLNWVMCAAFTILNFMWFYQLIKVALKPSKSDEGVMAPPPPSLSSPRLLSPRPSLGLNVTSPKGQSERDSLV